MPDIQKVSVALTSEQVSALQAAVDTGEYATTSEAVREALRDWKWKRDLRGGELNRLRQHWQEGKASGASAPLNLSATRKVAQRRLKKAASRAG